VDQARPVLQGSQLGGRPVRPEPWLKTVQKD
jgi:hypothetical protein